MRKFSKTLACFLLILTVTCTMPITIFAALPEDNNIDPQWNSISDVGIDIGFSGIEGNASGLARKKSTATRIEATMTVYKELANGTWEMVDQVYGSKTIGSLGLSIDFTGVVGVQYKAVFEVTAYTGDIPETETFERYATC